MLPVKFETFNRRLFGEGVLEDELELDEEEESDEFLEARFGIFIKLGGGGT